MSDSVRTRFAPSPTGYLHVGGARTALFNWLYARHSEGKFVLRIEDTDESRNTPEANAAIFDSLNWLGLDWDEGPNMAGDHAPYRQSERKEIYDQYFAKLEEAGLVYEEDGAMRFKAPNTDITVPDLIRGKTTFNNREEPDMTIRRADGSYIFHFVNVVDDIEMQITHVLRGDDHLSNTPRHLDLYRALDAPPPQFAHIPLILNQDGSKMSKRDQGASVTEYIEQGFLPHAVVNYLALLGWSPGEDREILELEEIIKLFDIPSINRSNAHFDLKKCRWMNQQYIQNMSDDSFLSAVRKDFSHLDLPDDALLLAKPRVETFSEVDEVLKPVADESADADPNAAAKVAANPQNKEVLTALAGLLDSAAWSEDGIKDAVAACAGRFELKPGKIMFPLRVAATGAPHGVDLVPSLIMIGQEETTRRIRARLQTIFPS
ncbi:MAG: glutamate--tRNA ligase family protein [Verrucomicrobiota bacterium]